MDQRIKSIEYSPAGPVSKAFMESNAFFRGLVGPLGSGKSSCCVAEILRRAHMQAPSPDGIRRTRWAVIRNTQPELKSTTIRTWFDWCPRNYGKVNFDSPIIHHIKTGSLDIEVIFLALDKIEDQKKVMSLDVTGIWLNEARFIPKGIVDATTARVGRYPSRLQGGPTWYGVIADTNAPDTESWWYKASEIERPQGWEFFKQPSGFSPQAENLENLPKNYYETIKQGKDPDWVRVFVDAEFGSVVEGQAVYQAFRERTHVSPEPLLPVISAPLLIGCDWGLTPAAVIGQKLVDGRWLILDELCTENTGVIRFSELLKKYIAENYRGFEVDCGFGDPAGNQRSQTDEKTALDIMKQHTGWRFFPAPSNDITMRKEVVVAALNRLVDGSPGILISPKCKMLRKGFTGGYHYKFIRSGDGTQCHETPAKNLYSHVHDALSYLLLGGGEHSVVMNRKDNRNGRRRTPRFAEGLTFKYDMDFGKPDW